MLRFSHVSTHFFILLLLPFCIFSTYTKKDFTILSYEVLSNNAIQSNRNMRSDLHYALFGLRTYIKQTYPALQTSDLISTHAHNTITNNDPQTVVNMMKETIRQECKYIQNEAIKELPGKHPLHHAFIPEVGYIYDHPERCIQKYKSWSPAVRLSGYNTPSIISDLSPSSPTLTRQRKSWNAFKRMAHIHNSTGKQGRRNTE